MPCKYCFGVKKICSIKKIALPLQHEYAQDILFFIKDNGNRSSCDAFVMLYD